MSISSTATVEHIEQVRREHKLLCRTQQHTSRPGMVWINELLCGHRMRMYESLRFYPETFCQLVSFIKQNNLLPIEHRTTQVQIEEALGIFLTIIARNDSQRSASETFQHSLEIINRHVKIVAEAISKMAPTFIQQKNMTGVHSKIRHNTRFWPWFKVKFQSH
ncbi:hypothetical protein H5410_013240 [Solanum commersonii]|uniref:DUF8040 domain-containing protein n=1 Tax=Solanum commersonii TaxID=4109 RepID=A0A9J6ATZ8_SOLCO|nr:hypothetical protein H5410_013240 [Solanum commersonii]